MTTRDYSPSACIRRALRDDALKNGVEPFENSYVCGALSFLVVQLYDRGEVERCAAVRELRRLEAAGRLALESEAAR